MSSEAGISDQPRSEAPRSRGFWDPGSGRRDGPSGGVPAFDGAHSWMRLLAVSAIHSRPSRKPSS